MKTLLLTLTFATVFEAHAITAQVCRAQCVALDRSQNLVVFLGDISGIHQNRNRAWELLKKSCTRKVRRTGGAPVLASGSVFMDSDLSYGGSSSTSGHVSYSWNRTSVSSSQTQSFYQNDRLILELNLAAPKESCSLEDVSEEDLEPVYDGDLPIFG